MNVSTRRTAALFASTAAAVLIAGTAASSSANAASAAQLQDDVASVRSVHAQLDEQWGDDDTNEDENAIRDGDSDNDDDDNDDENDDDNDDVGDWRANRDQGSLSWINKKYGAQQTWNKIDSRGNRLTGQGVTVAVIDTGIAPVEGLTTSGKVVNGPDLSFESQAEGTRYLDGYGHGTHMAGIIAGLDSDIRTGLVGPQNFVGVAPGARILNMKVATADGGVDVSQVIAAIDWVVQHRNDNGMNVRVINLSYGTPSTQSYLLDPLAHAVESAWRHGIVVVAAAGNNKLDTPILTMPAVNPYVIAVGAVDHLGTRTTSDDVVADFTNGGNAARRPDLIAPGKSVVSLRVPGSIVDTTYPEGRVTGDDTDRFFRGSGTSQAAAVVSGAVALMLQHRPELTPDQVKYLLESSADPLKDNPSPAMGAGVIDIDGAVKASTPDPATAAQTWDPSTGLGTLEASRGGIHVEDPENGVTLVGEVDALGSQWDGRSWSLASSLAVAWNGGTWNGGDWTGDGWTGRSWSGAAWEGRSWSGRSWSGIDWQGRSWSTDYWNGRSWSGRSWSGRSWSDASWQGRSWSGILGRGDDLRLFW